MNAIVKKITNLSERLQAYFDDDRVDLDTDLDYDHVVYKKAGLFIIFITFGLFGFWSILAPLDGAALAPGVVVVSSYRQTLQHLEGGIIKEIKIAEGEYVNKGDVLVLLDDTQARAQLDIVLGQYYVALASDARLIAEGSYAEKVTYPVKLHGEDNTIKEAVKTQNQIFKTRRAAHLGERSVLQHRVEQLIEQKKGLLALQKSKNLLAVSYAEEIDDFQALFQEGFADKLHLRDLQRNAVKLDGEIAESHSSIARVSIQVGETQLQLLQLDKVLQTRVADERSQIQAKLFDLEERAAALSDRVLRMEIRAPMNGMILGLTVHTLGAVISPGQIILNVVPQEEKMLVEAQVSPIDIDRVILGQGADIGFSGLSSSTPKLYGKVESISADRLTDERTGMPYFLARVSISEEELGRLGDDELVPGMSAEVYIETGSRTLFQYMMKPLRETFARSMIED